MADQTKPRYRLGIQWHLDNAKDDATKIPERTLFKISETGDFPRWADRVVWRDERDCDGRPGMVWMVWGPDRINDAHFLEASDLKAFI